MVAVPDAYIRTVVFLCVDERDDLGKPRRIPQATGFFVRVPLNVRLTESVDYLVTARHCVEEAMGYEHLWIRWNLKAGGFIEFPTRFDDWIMSDQADVAAILMLRSALPEGVSPSDFDTASLRMADFVGPEPEYKYVGETGIGHMEIQPRVGHEVYFLGLFTQQYGQERNLPIARFGHIARMPSAVEMEGPGGTRFESVVYLVEFQSWGGHSGSPVFFEHQIVVEDQILVDETTGQHVLTGVDEAHISGFMGLVSGHYGIPIKAETKGDILGEIQTQLNSGIAMVTPADAVRQLLMRTDVVEHREEQAAKLL